MASPIPAGNPVFLAEETKISNVYRCYLAFSAMAKSLGHADLSHRLVLCEPLSIAGEAPLIAAGIASAGTLCIEPDPSAVRHSIRSGAIDFAVNNLDEALRALKNEIRKGLSIAICLEADPSAVLAEMAERGVQPDVLCSSRLDLHAETFPELFIQRGAARLDLTNTPPLQDMIEMQWWPASQPGKWLPLLDDLVATSIPEDDPVRRNWLRRAPRYLGRTLRTRRYLPMTLEESQRCIEAFRQQIQGPQWQGIEAHIAPVEGSGPPLL